MNDRRRTVRLEEPSFLPRALGVPRARALREGTALARQGMGVDEGIGFDLRIIEVIAYDRLTILLFACGCRLVLPSEREPVTLACPEHGGES